MSNVSGSRQGGQRWFGRLLLGAAALLPLVTRPQAPAAPVRPLVEVRTLAGRMVIALYNETPLHRDNFLALVRAGAYDSLLFHRVVPGFMVQGGHPDSRRAEPGAALGDGGREGALPAEINPAFCHLRGAVAAVREPDPVNPERRSDGSQFYIVHGRPYTGPELDQVAARNARYGTPVRYSAEQRAAYAKEGGAPHLDGSYTIFGEVVEGLDVLDAIANAPSDGRDRPLKDIRTFMRVME